MYQILLNISSFSIIIPFILLFFRLRVISANTLPIYLLILLHTISEIASYLGSNGHYPKFFVNIFILLEALIVFIQLRTWLNSEKEKKIISWLCFLTALIWIIEALFLDPFNQLLYVVIYFSNFFIVFFSIKKLNEIIFLKQRIYLSPELVFCTAFILFFSYLLLVQIFFSNFINPSKAFKVNLMSIMIVVNLASNLLYAYGIYIFPKKKNNEPNLALV
jgi:hypothetical protein